MKHKKKDIDGMMGIIYRRVFKLPNDATDRELDVAIKETKKKLEKEVDSMQPNMEAIFEEVMQDYYNKEGIFT